MISNIIRNPLTAHAGAFSLMRQLPQRLTLKAAKVLAWTLGFPSKMPGTSYGIPTHSCNVGGKLREIPGSGCFGCYAHEKNNYAYPSVRIAQERRLASLQNVGWSAAMVYMLRKAHGLDGFKPNKRLVARGGVGFHRWHDSGDVQGVWHMLKIIEVCRATPEIQHWLPIREVGVLLKLRAMGIEIPANLITRVSSPMIDGPVTDQFPNTSTIHDKKPAQGHECVAPLHDNTCGPCRACWDPAIANTSYKLH
jgi:hypothetical protein